ncbi:NAD(P)-binding protein [Acaromyces ingoldii]|uniref:NAD(P)-binding protein n=1 Tax=Acaromyces ingoldii TaxID=215250 RepID=A0A316YGL4_9BASI|nr:NAD(P)-binding protein [Acaromyces ingoldii]PWN87984.1 NAD(P)-binding protein [Acaromyces ingoldii]
MAREGLIYLITGASRGIGRSLTALLLSRPNNTVIAAVRKIDDDNAKALNALPRESGSKIILVKLDGVVESDAHAAVDTLIKAHHIEHIDVVIANAGVNDSLPSVNETTPDNIRRTLDINVYAPLTLFQATRSLLKASPSVPKFVIISSIAGSLDYISKSPLSNLSYSVSKAAVNVLGVRIAAEESDITTLLLHPGLVETDMVHEFIERHPSLKLELSKMDALKVDDSSANIVKVIDGAKKDDSGRFVDATTGENIPW